MLLLWVQGRFDVGEIQEGINITNIQVAFSPSVDWFSAVVEFTGYFAI